METRRSRTVATTDLAKEGPDELSQGPSGSTMDVDSLSTPRDGAVETTAQKLDRLRQVEAELILAEEVATLEARIARRRANLEMLRADPGDTPISEDSSEEYSHDDEGQRGRPRGQSKRARIRAPTMSESEAAPTSHKEQINAESKYKISDLSEYEGRSIKEHTNFINACELAFRIKPVTYTSNRSRVLYAAQWLRKKPAEQWTRYEKTNGKDITTWEDFVTILLDWVQSPKNRHLATAEKFESAIQGPTQDVRGFALYLQSLEDELPPYKEDHKKQHFLTKLRPELRRGILALENMPETRDEMIESAARIEEHLRAERKEKREKPADSGAKSDRGCSGSSSKNKHPKAFSGKREYRSQNGKEGSSHPPNRAESGKTPATTVNATALPVRPRDGSQVECYNCHKLGHYANECKAPKVRSATDKTPGKGKVSRSRTPDRKT